MTYVAGTPLAGEAPSVSQPKMQTNFAQLKTYLDLEHLPITTGALNGKHKWMTLSEIPTSFPAPPGPVGTDLLLKKTLVGNTWYVEFLDGGGRIWYVPLRREFTPIVIPAGSALTNILDLATLGYVGASAIAGTVQLYDNGNPTRTLFSPFSLFGGNLYLPGVSPNYSGQLASGSQFPGFEGAGTMLKLRGASVPAGTTITLIITESFT